MTNAPIDDRRIIVEYNGLAIAVAVHNSQLQELGCGVAPEHLADFVDPCAVEVAKQNVVAAPRHFDTGLYGKSVVNRYGGHVRARVFGVRRSGPIILSAL
jgi:hypothetical protein